MSSASNITTVTFKLTPAYYTVLHAMATAEGKGVSTFVRETIVESLDLEHQAQRLRLMLQGMERAWAAGRLGSCSLVSLDPVARQAYSSSKTPRQFGGFGSLNL